MTCAHPTFENFLKKAFELIILIVTAKTKADRRAQSLEAADAFVLQPSL